MQVLSFGAGVQSVTIMEMIFAKELPRPGVVIFADTQNEPQSVYDAVSRASSRCDAIGLPFFSVTKGDLGAWKRNRSVHVPLFTVDQTTGERGQLFRTCTDRFKIDAVKAKCRALGMGHRKEGAEMIIGFSLDEISRVGGGQKLPKWITRKFPLLELEMRRSDCHAYLRRAGVTAGKSACTFCPFRTHEGWMLMKRRDPTAFEEAQAYDESIRDCRPGFKSYVHQHCIALSKVPMPPPSLFDAEEFVDSCETGFCEMFP